MYKCIPTDVDMMNVWREGPSPLLVSTDFLLTIGRAPEQFKPRRETRSCINWIITAPPIMATVITPLSLKFSSLASVHNI